MQQCFQEYSHNCPQLIKTYHEMRLHEKFETLHRTYPRVDCNSIYQCTKSYLGFFNRLLSYVSEIDTDDNSISSTSSTQDVLSTHVSYSAYVCGARSTQADCMMYSMEVVPEDVAAVITDTFSHYNNIYSDICCGKTFLQLLSIHFCSSRVL